MDDDDFDFILLNWSTNNRARQRRRDYEDFLRSREWAQIREAALARAGHACTKCGATHKLHVHHKNYYRFGGAEFARDLTVVLSPHTHDYRERYLKQLRGER